MQDFPFEEISLKHKRVRIFNSDIPDEELVWHRDKKDRIVKVIENQGWGFQKDNELPLLLEEEGLIFIPRMSWLRVIKGHGNLVIEVYEEGI